MTEILEEMLRLAQAQNARILELEVRVDAAERRAARVERQYREVLRLLEEAEVKRAR